MEQNAERIRYKCKNCRYEFTRKVGIEVKKCPYCSKEGYIELMGDFASKVLDEVSKIGRMGDDG